MGLRRLRGGMLRLALNRRGAAIAGVVLLMPALLLIAGDFPWEGWPTDGLTLVLAGTGLALLMTALGGRRPDWIDADNPPTRRR